MFEGRHIPFLILQRNNVYQNIHDIQVFKFIDQVEYIIQIYSQFSILARKCGFLFTEVYIKNAGEYLILREMLSRIFSLIVELNDVAVFNCVIGH